MQQAWEGVIMGLSQGGLQVVQQQQQVQQVEQQQQQQQQH
jgi:hypothetical protein